jgi:hypothetical protein
MSGRRRRVGLVASSAPEIVSETLQGATTKATTTHRRSTRNAALTSSAPREKDHHHHHHEEEEEEDDEKASHSSSRKRKGHTKQTKSKRSTTQVFIDVIKVYRACNQDITPYSSKYFTMPSRFLVPDKAPWPSEMRGKTFQVTHLRSLYKRGMIDSALVDELRHLGFVWDVQEHEWTLTIAALKIFRDLHGHINVPPAFRIPANENDATWPVELANMYLGLAVVKLKEKAVMPRQNSNALSLEKKAVLESLGFFEDIPSLSSS